MIKPHAGVPHPFSANEFLVDLAKNLPGIVYIGRNDADRSLIFWHQNGLDPLQIPPYQEHTSPLLWADFIAADDRDDVLAEIQQAARERRPYRCIYRLNQTDQDVHWVLERGQLNVEGLLIGFITDHTDRMETLQQQERQMAIIEERHRLARELHDSVSQSLYSLALFAQAGRSLAEQGQLQAAVAYFGDMVETTSQALREMRLLVHKLRPALLAEVGLLRAIEMRLQAVEGRAGVAYTLQADSVPELPEELEEALYHIAQEALNNCLKHAGAGRITVSIHHQAQTGELRLTIQDDGQGFDLAAGRQQGGLGLTTMSERAAAQNGRLTIHSSAETGTTIEAVFHI